MWLGKYDAGGDRKQGINKCWSYVYIITQARVLCPIYIRMMPEDMQDPRVSAYISGKARVPVLQLICYTSGRSKNLSKPAVDCSASLYSNIQ